MTPARRRPLVAALPLLLSATVVPVALTASSSGAAAPPGERPVAAAARAWVTTPAPDGLRMADQGSVPFTDGGSDRLTLTVDPSLRYQRMDGFGASITDSSASLLMDLDATTRDATMRDLFADNGISFLRQPVGSSDFVDGPHYTYDDVAAGRDRLRPLGSSRSSTTAPRSCRCCARRRELNPGLKVMATPWSPPAWMKTGDSLVGGRLKDDPRVYQAYADYLVKFVQAYAAEGVPVYGLTIQNEPQNRHPSGYPGTDLPVRQAVAVIDRLGPALRAAGLSTKIFGYDHNWSLHPDDDRRRPRPVRTRSASTPPTCSSRPPAAGWPARRTTATPGTRSG